MKYRKREMYARIAMLAAGYFLLAVMLAGCREPLSTDGTGDPMNHDPPGPAGPFNLDDLLGDGYVREGIERERLVDILKGRPGAELIEVTSHNANITLLTSLPNTARSEVDDHPCAPMVFLLHDDHLALAFETRAARAGEIEAISERVRADYDRKVSYPPQALREWAAASDYFENVDFELYLNTETAIARNTWHYSNINASLRQTKSRDESCWFMVEYRKPDPQVRTSRRKYLEESHVAHGVIAARWLPDHPRETWQILRECLENLPYAPPYFWRDFFPF